MPARRRRRPEPDPPPHAPGEPARRSAGSDAPRTATFNIVFVCTGNTCRSPMAEVIARDELARRGWSHVRVASAGVAAGEGGPASEEAVGVVRRHGLELDAHRSQRLTPELVAWADLVLAMGPSHLPSIARAGGAGKAALLTDFAAEPGSGGVGDPFGGTAAVYEETYRELQRLVRAALDRLGPILSP